MTGEKQPVNGSEGAGQAAGSKAGARGRDGDEQTTATVAEGSHAAVQASSPAELPVDSLREAAPYLRRPFMPEAIRFKIQTEVKGPQGKPPKGGIIVAYIDARLVVERLNAVCPHLWFDQYELLPGGKHMRCRLTVDGVTREDVGEASGLSKDLYSDALKRAAVKFGVGVSVYALPQVFLPVGEKALEVTGAKKLRLTDAALDRLRGGYTTWLAEKGKQFGGPLDHGDTLEPLAGEVFEDTESDEDPAVEIAEGPEADGLRDQIKAAYDELRELDATVVTPAEYARRRAEADRSVVGLTELLGFLDEKLTEQKAAV